MTRIVEVYEDETLRESWKPLNTMPDGTAGTIKSQYYKSSFANFIRQGTFGATAVIETYGEDNADTRKDAR